MGVAEVQPGHMPVEILVFKYSVSASASNARRDSQISLTASGARSVPVSPLFPRGAVAAVEVLFIVQFPLCRVTSASTGWMMQSCAQSSLFERRAPTNRLRATGAKCPACRSGQYRPGDGECRPRSDSRHRVGASLRCVERI